MRALLITLMILSTAALGACDSAGGGGPVVVSGTQTVRAEQGLSFRDGAVVESANFSNSDLFATRNGTSLKLSTGGDDPTDNRPANWFKTSGGVFQTFGSLAEVPSEIPGEAMTESLVKAKTGNGFVLLTAGGAYARGWISAADADAVTIQFEPLTYEE